MMHTLVSQMLASPPPPQGRIKETEEAKPHRLTWVLNQSVKVCTDNVCQSEFWRYALTSRLYLCEGDGEAGFDNNRSNDRFR